MRIIYFTGRYPPDLPLPYPGHVEEINLKSGIEMWDLWDVGRGRGQTPFDAPKREGISNIHNPPPMLPDVLSLEFACEVLIPAHFISFKRSRALKELKGEKEKVLMLHEPPCLPIKGRTKIIIFLSAKTLFVTLLKKYSSLFN